MTMEKVESLASQMASWFRRINAVSSEEPDYQQQITTLMLEEAQTLSEEQCVFLERSMFHLEVTKVIHPDLSIIFRALVQMSRNLRFKMN